MPIELSSPAKQSSSLVEILRWRALHQPERCGYTFLTDGETEEIHLTYGELDLQARAIASLLQGLGLVRHRALLLYPPSLEYIIAFFGCLYAGWAAVPCYPPRRNRPESRLRTIVDVSQVSVALTNSSILSSMEHRLAHNPGLEDLRWIATDNLAASDTADRWQDPKVDGNSLAFLQYTSGSTAAPKGVMISHGNLVHNSGLSQRGFGLTPNSQGVSWLPPYHDMGLIGGILQPLYSGFPVRLMPPFYFIQRPARWLQAITRYQATVSGGPNFAYDLCVSRVSEEQKASLDLSSLEVAFSGAEPVRHETIERFTTAFEPCGFRREAFYPCYGLAEATLFVSGGLHKAPPVFGTVRKDALEEGKVVATHHGDEAGQTLVGCGQAPADQWVLIVDPQSLAPSPSDEVGEIWVSGPSIAQGYWDRPAETVSTFQAYPADSELGPFLRTGDLGFVRDGELYITGRLKDLIIIDGRNHYPQDIELTVEASHSALRPSCSAAFSIDLESKERLVIVAEVDRHYRPSRRQGTEAASSGSGKALSAGPEEVIRAIRKAVAFHHDIATHDIRLLKAWTIPKTSSGKIQRHACRDRYLSGTLDERKRW